MTALEKIEAEIRELQKADHFRELRCLSGVDFCSNDYLGFARSPQIKSELIQLFNSRNDLLGATGSRLISGESGLQRHTEEVLQTCFGSESALLFGSGYLANVGVTQALGSHESEFFSDEFNHASLIDGMRLSKAKISVYPHRNLEVLSSLLARSRAQRKIIVTESVFSMSGKSPDLKAIVELSNRHGCILVVDEAHATGVIGEEGHGLLHGENFDPGATVIIHTCGKALGAYGAFVLSDLRLRHFFVNKVRTFIFSTALPPSLLGHILIAVRAMRERGDLRRRLSSNVEYLREALLNLNTSWEGRHISFLPFSGNTNVQNAAAVFQSKGVAVTAIRSPTVPKGSEGIRVTLKAFHTPSDLELLVRTMKEVNS